MRRAEGWEIRLGEYIEAERHKPFEWGVNDCVTFANGAVVAQTGQGFCDDWCGKVSTAKEAVGFFRQRLAAGDYNGPLNMMDARLDRGEGFPPRGSIIAREIDDGFTGYALGVTLSAKAAFVACNGLYFAEIINADTWWAIE